ncbi:Uncharacterised protein [Raoultella ornithinolytica]|nr:Uncharacterised protein [Raoultella ornithinolytica]
MRILMKALFGVAEANFAQQGQHLLLTYGGGLFLVQTQNFANLRADRLYRVQGVARVLRDQTDARAAQTIKSFPRPAADILAIDLHSSTVASGIVRQQADNGLGGGGFAGTRLPDKCQHFTALQAETDVMHHFLPAVLRAVADAQVFHA